MKTILIVDDETVLIETICRGLRMRGYRVLGAAGGLRALDWIRRDGNIDLMLTDYVMPDLNGIELLKAIRRIRRDLPVVMMTTLAGGKTVAAARDYRCNHLIEKPFTLEQLVSVIEGMNSGGGNALFRLPHRSK